MSAPLPPSTQKPPPVPPERPTGWRRWILPVTLLLSFLILTQGFGLFSAPPDESYTYTEYLTAIEEEQIATAVIDPTGAIEGELENGGTYVTAVPVSAGEPELLARLDAAEVEVEAIPESASLLGLFIAFLPILFLVLIFVWIVRSARKGGGLGGLGGIGRSRAKLFDAERPSTRFSDVAGYEGAKQEISEVVDFLKNPGRYKDAGAKGPRGVLMVGPPGTGKTLLARAVAGEAEVPFFSVTGSSFVEMFVGVGAARVRDLFSEARKRSPAIIFVDEIDAIGGRRGNSGFGSNDEREQTLNQLLSEMDGFEASDVVVLAATNRPESLDPALSRPGRFDRQVSVTLPNQQERLAILQVHVRGKRLDPDVDLSIVSRGTPGFSGADLATLVNEAAIFAVRSGRTTLTALDFDAARDRALLGRRDASNALLPEEQQSVAVHESGHALVAALCASADPVAKVTILPAGMALGVTEQLPEAERHLYSESYMLDSLAVRLGGRAAELVCFGEGSTGASNDLAGATELATRMIREFGLSSRLGPVGYSSGGPRYLGGPDAAPRNYSEETQRTIDLEVARLLREAEARAVQLLTEHRRALDLLTERLLKEETVDGSVVYEVLRGAGGVPRSDRSSRPEGFSGEPSAPGTPLVIQG